MWQRIRDFFKDSETIAWARFQSFIGTVCIIITYVEPSVLAPVMPAEWFPWIVLANGIATEVLRRLRAEDL